MATPSRQRIMPNLALCPTHRIVYNQDLDGSCPQCALQRMAPPEPLQIDAATGHAVRADGSLVDAKTLRPVK